MDSLKSEQKWEIIDSHTALIKDLFQLIKEQDKKIKVLSEQIATASVFENNVLKIDSVEEQEPSQILENKIG